MHFDNSEDREIEKIVAQYRNMGVKMAGKGFRISEEKRFDPDEVAKELCSVQQIHKDEKLVKQVMEYMSAGVANKDKHDAYIFLDKATIDDLIPIVDNRISFLQNNKHKNPSVLEPQLKRLQELFKVLDRLSTEC